MSSKIKKGIITLSAVLLTIAGGMAVSAPAAQASPSHSYQSSDGGEGDWPVPRAC
ncbi:MAG: hypothetical protein L0G99_14280 [Propionibacteriales bacterium]|nr:hypothetical protein [Propionibacteriales bacterium]